MKALLSFLQKEYNQPKLLVVVGSPGDKGFQDGRLCEVLNEYADRAILTTDDPVMKISCHCGEILRYHQDKVDTTVEIDRATAIKQAIEESQPGTLLYWLLKGRMPIRRCVVSIRRIQLIVIAKQVAQQLS